MKRSARTGASIAVAAALTLAAAATGCEIIADFDRSKIDAGGGQEDAALYDAQYPESDGVAPIPDAFTPSEGSPNETGAAEAGPDSSQVDGQADGGPDSNGSDAGDGNAPDANVTDANDANVPDANDANVPETGDDSGD